LEKYMSLASISGPRPFQALTTALNKQLLQLGLPSSTLSTQSSSSSSSPPLSPSASETCPLQKEIFQILSSSELIGQPLQVKIRDIFIKMAENMSFSDPEATLYPKLALYLLSSDERAESDKIRVKLLMILGKAHLDIGNKESIQKSLEYYKEGLHLKHITPHDKAKFYLSRGHAYIIRNRDKDANKAIEHFQKALLTNIKDPSLLGDIHCGLGEAYYRRSKHKDPKNLPR
jgi:tetratricopeptide (TPR) repeat protein